LQEHREDVNIVQVQFWLTLNFGVPYIFLQLLHTAAGNFNASQNLRFACPYAVYLGTKLRECFDYLNFIFPDPRCSHGLRIASSGGLDVGLAPVDLKAERA
jgi:hypothetical protein